MSDVLLNQRRSPGKVRMQGSWQTGATSEHAVTPTVRSYAHYAFLPALQARLCELCVAQQMDLEVAATLNLNKEGRRTARGFPFSDKLVWRLRKKWHLPGGRVVRPHPARY